MPCGCERVDKVGVDDVDGWMLSVPVWWAISGK